MIRRLNLQRPDQAERLVALQRASYRVEADLIGYDDLPPLRESAADLAASGETLWGYFVEAELAGAIGYTCDDDVLDIHRLAVSPAHFRRGIAAALLTQAEDGARAAGVRRVIVSTGAANAPAVAFYQRAGFRLAHQNEVVPGLLIVHFVKRW